jgi:hypothetical protein
MATMTKFEDIKAWQKARSFCHEVFILMEETELARDFKLKEQLNDQVVPSWIILLRDLAEEEISNFCNFLKLVMHPHAKVNRSSTGQWIVNI